MLVKALVESEPGGASGLAREMNVSAVTVTRWMSGQSRPRPSIEGRLRAHALKQHVLASRLPWRSDGPDSFSPTAEHRVRRAVGATLREVREVLHRSGSLSSRHEALDEIAKLLFAHVVSIDTGGNGIGHHILQGSKSSVTALSEFVAESFNSFLPESLSVELGASDFALKLRPSEERLSLELVNCFAEKFPKAELLRARGPGQLDILNEVFGQFLADSFVDERELGQYLTPTEVVRTMVVLGLDSLEDGVVESMLSLDVSQRPAVILDPSCGVGSFLVEALRVLCAKAKVHLASADLERWIISALRHTIIGIDKSERMIRLATTNLALFGAPAANLHLANSLVRTGADGELCETFDGRASLILTNPPFGAEFSGRDLLGYRIAQTRGRIGQKTVDSEILFLERYLDWLAPGGVLVSIVPDSVLTNRGLFSELRSAISETAELLSVVSLPKVTFEAAGTSTKTSILHLRKRRRRTGRMTFFAICHKIGYDVVTKGSQRYRIPRGSGQLPQILDEATGSLPPAVGRWVLLDSNAARWDATYHASLPRNIQRRLEDPEPGDVFVCQVAAINKERADPRRFGEAEFRYVEISDVDARTCEVSHKLVRCCDAPSRARKVIRPGDVLVSTVRPERRTVGVVGEELDEGICSTGFAVLKPNGIDPHTLARLLQSDFVNAQVLRNNVGIAYPTVDENCLSEVLLPINENQLGELASSAIEVAAIRSRLRKIEDNFSSKVNDATSLWLGS